MRKSTQKTKVSDLLILNRPHGLHALFVNTLVSTAEGFEILANILDYIRGGENDLTLVETKWVGEGKPPEEEDKPKRKRNNRRRKKKTKKIERVKQTPPPPAIDLIAEESVTNRVWNYANLCTF